MTWIDDSPDSKVHGVNMGPPCRPREPCYLGGYQGSKHSNGHQVTCTNFDKHRHELTSNCLLLHENVIGISSYYHIVFRIQDKAISLIKCLTHPLDNEILSSESVSLFWLYQCNKFQSNLQTTQIGPLMHLTQWKVEWVGLRWEVFLTFRWESFLDLQY